MKLGTQRLDSALINCLQCVYILRKWMEIVFFWEQRISSWETCHPGHINKDLLHNSTPLLWKLSLGRAQTSKRSWWCLTQSHVRHVSSSLVLMSWSTVSAAARCWPGAVFHKILDDVDIRAHVFYKHFLQKKITLWRLPAAGVQNVSASITLQRILSNTAMCMMRM